MKVLVMVSRKCRLASIVQMPVMAPSVHFRARTEAWTCDATKASAGAFAKAITVATERWAQAVAAAGLKADHRQPNPQSTMEVSKMSLRFILGGAIGLWAIGVLTQAHAQGTCLPALAHTVSGVATVPQRSRLSLSLTQVGDGANAYSAQVRGTRSADLRIELRAATETSALFTSSTTAIFRGEAQTPEVRVAVLAVRSPDRRMLPQAGIVWTRDSVSAAYLAAGNSSDTSTVFEVLMLERLYAMIHQSDPTLRFHEELQAQVAKARECSVARLPKDTPVRPVRWEQARLTMLPTSSANERTARLRVRDARGKPVASASVAFARGEHLACQALTDSSGVATCELFDSHGHADHEDVRGPTLVTFGGSVSETVILLPRAAMMK